MISNFRINTYALWLIASLLSLPNISFAIGDFGPDTCAEGFVWREACGPSDHVCVTPNIRSQARDDNAQAAARRQPEGSHFGDTCLPGFVRREACGPQDHVCVPPITRLRAEDDNKLATHRLKYPVCRDYAQKAVNANQQNLQKKCGFSGSQWQSNFDAHFKWCLNVGADGPIGEEKARNQQLSQCAHSSDACGKEGQPPCQGNKCDGNLHIQSKHLNGVRSAVCTGTCGSLHQSPCVTDGSAIGVTNIFHCYNNTRMDNDCVCVFDPNANPCQEINSGGSGMCMNQTFIPSGCR
jgi:hypothetical protein